jgi:CRP/FNR family transcriptional regulator, anaerobic regulatory protein
MLVSSPYPLHREEIAERLLRGDQKIAALMNGQRKLEPHRILIKTDTDHDFVYRLRVGWAGIVRALPDGRNQFILLFLPGDLFSVKSVFLKRHADTVETLSEIVADQVNVRTLREACERDPDIAFRCNWQVVDEQRRLHNWVVGLGRGSAEERMAMLLIDLHGRLARAGAIAPEATEFPLPLTQNQLGDLLGLSPVHINRVLKGLREDGILTIRGGRVSVDDPEELKFLATPLLDHFERTAPEAGRPSEPI